MHRRVLSFVVGLSLALAASQATAKHDHEDDDEKGGQGRRGDSSVDAHIDAALFGPSQRTIVREYYQADAGRRKCPPGLAKKHNGCLPPGQARKQYAIGHDLGPDVVIFPLPPDLDVRLGAPPRGYRYGIINGDVVKLAVGTLLVVDAIDGLIR
jgi:hypothetical protein